MQCFCRFVAPSCLSRLPACHIPNMMPKAFIRILHILSFAASLLAHLCPILAAATIQRWLYLPVRQCLLCTAIIMLASQLCIMCASQLCKFINQLSTSTIIVKLIHPRKSSYLTSPVLTAPTIRIFTVIPFWELSTLRVGETLSQFYVPARLNLSWQGTMGCMVYTLKVISALKVVLKCSDRCP